MSDAHPYRPLHVPAKRSWLDELRNRASVALEAGDSEQWDRIQKEAESAADEGLYHIICTELFSLSLQRLIKAEGLELTRPRHAGAWHISWKEDDEPSSTLSEVK